MTTIRLAARLEDSGSGTEPLVSAGWGYRVRNSVDYVDSNGDLVVAAWPAGGGWKAFNASVVTLDLDPRPPDEPYLLQIRGPIDPSAAVKVPTVREEYRQVLNSTANGTSWYALNRVTGPGPDGTEYPIGGYDDLVAQIADLQDQINNLTVGGGGASTLAGITDMSANARSFNGAANYLAMRNLLLASGLTTVDDLTVGDDATITGDLAVSGTVTLPTGSVAQSAVNGLSAALVAATTSAQGFVELATTVETTTGTDTTRAVTPAGLAAAISGMIYPHYAVAGTYPGRPVTSRPVWWMSWDVAPPATSGTTTSGTGPVVGLDVVFLGVGVVPG